MLIEGYKQFVMKLIELKKVLSQEQKWALKEHLTKEFNYEVYEKNVEYWDSGSESTPCACKQALGSSQGLFYLWVYVKGCWKS